MTPSKHASIENIPMILKNRTKANLRIPKRLKQFINRRKQSNGPILCIFFAIGVVLMAYGLIRSIFLISKIYELENDGLSSTTSEIEVSYTATMSTTDLQENKLVRIELPQKPVNSTISTEITTTTNHLIVPISTASNTPIIEPSATVSSAKSAFFFKSCKRRVVGYFDLKTSETPTNEQLSLLTHISFFVFRYISDAIVLSDDIQIKLREHVTRAKNFNVTTMVASGGLSDGLRFTAEPEKRKKWIESMYSLITEYQLDGVDIVWMNPYDEKDYSNLISLCKELREKIDASERKLWISHFVSASPRNFRLQNQVLQYVDFLNIDTHDYYNFFNVHDHLVGPSSPLYSGHGYEWNENVDKTMRQFSCWTKTPEKLNMVFSPQANYWNNVIVPMNSSNTLWMTAEPINGTISGGYEWFRSLMRIKWDFSKESWNNESKTPYIWNPASRKYLAFENERSMEEKAKYAIKKNIGGVTFYEMRYDESNTLLKAIVSAEFCTENAKNVVEYNCDEI